MSADCRKYWQVLRFCFRRGIQKYLRKAPGRHKRDTTIGRSRGVNTLGGEAFNSNAKAFPLTHTAERWKQEYQHLARHPFG